MPAALSRFAWATALATLGLIALGGLVTSHGVGMAVPDWPTTYGYNMFLFPVSQWVGGVFYEHTHRLYASLVGLLTLILAVWLQWRSPSRTLARWAWVALALVVLQGVLGGLRVNLMMDSLGIGHAALAQAFLVLLVLLAVATTRRWQRWCESGPSVDPAVGRWVLGTTVLIFIQLVLGASMRHQHAGLAVPDFPLAYGRVWPPTDAAFLDRVNALRADIRDFHPITAAHVHLHMTHRLLGIALVGLVAVAAMKLRRGFRGSNGLRGLAYLWKGLIAVQVLLGASTVWFNKAADVATAHVVVGAACLAVGAIGSALCVVAARRGTLADGRKVGSPVLSRAGARSDAAVPSAG